MKLTLTLIRLTNNLIGGCVMVMPHDLGGHGPSTPDVDHVQVCATQVVVAGAAHRNALG